MGVGFETVEAFAVGGLGWVGVWAGVGEPLGAGNGVTLRDLLVFAEEATEPIVPRNRCAVVSGLRFRGGQLVWWSLSEGSVRPMTFVVLRVLVDDEAEVVLSRDQDAVGGLTATRSDPAR
ncbi:hypothetical protein GCM10022420_060200 [Streptomyces iranensis]|uniref:Uncharacterized protein n=1 Tax=Streptomyces iranensis TaxID=576784 RepID=A0A060ZHP0_9ACTN|nr:predicted protein [Streptomyces iranensis]